VSAEGEPICPEFSGSIDLRFARRIRQRRLRLAMTQQRLAGYEHGISRISAGRLHRLATALEAPITFFLEDDNDGRT
jgi:transcriptional regulator with XRE-family HTH domain